MKVVIFGSTGNTGLCAVDAALKKGYEVRAFVRDKARLPNQYISNEKLEVITGDALNSSDVDKAVSGTDGVVVALGTRNALDPTTALSEGTRNIVAAMKAHQVDKISVCLSAFLFYEPEKLPPRFIELNADHERMYNILKDSGLKYIAVLPPHIADSPSAKVTVEHGKSPGRHVSKWDLGEFLVSSLNLPEHYGQRVGIANLD